jgi:hypothetical protein
MAVKLKRTKAEAKPDVKKPDRNFGLRNLAPDPKLPKGYLSLSAVRMYLRCAKQFEFRYIEGRKEPPAVALIEGGAHHNALQLDNEHRIKHKKPAKITDMIGHFVASLEKGAQNLDNWEGESKDIVIARGKDLLNTYASKFQWLEPVTAEEYFELMLGDVPVLGYIDVIDAQRVLDYKVVGRAKSEADAQQDLQLLLYGKVKKKKRVGFVSLVKTASNPDKKIQHVETKVTEQEMDWAGEVIQSAAVGIRAGVFPKTEPGNWWCSEKFCGFWHLCRGKKR